MDSNHFAESEVSFGAWIRARRNALDLTQQELARLASCSVSAIRKIESDQRRPSRQLAELLAEHLRVPEEGRQTFLSVARAQRSVDRLPPPRLEAAERPAYLPVPARPLIGRQPELEALLRMLSDPACRLLTIVGPGGIGKSRLALEAAARHSERTGMPACFAPLASIDSSTYLVPAIADTMGISLHGQTDPSTLLLALMSGYRTVLVLDNVEHLLDGVALFADMLDRAPELKLLATSRERLNLHGEWIFELQGMPVPATQHPEEYDEVSSVALFLQSARLSRADFRLSAEDWPNVVRICRLVGGLPLGIELAAAWVSVLDVDEIAGEIEKDLDFLATDLRDLPERQRSLRAAFDHSWRLLTPEERTALGRLAIFQGGFDRTAAEEIASVTVQRLSSLLAKSLVRRGERGRFDLHEVIRQYARGRLEEAGGVKQLQERHAAYYLRQLVTRERLMASNAGDAALRELTTDLDNLRSAWVWAVENQKFEALEQAMRSLGRLYHSLGWLREGVEKIELVVRGLGDDRTSSHPRLLGLALAQQGLLLFRRGRFDRARDRFEAALESLRPLDDPTLLHDALCNSAIILHLAGDYELAAARMTESLSGAQAAGDRWYEAYARFNLGYIDGLLGQYEAGLEQMQASLETWRQLGDPRSIALGLNHLAPALIELGRAAEARELLRESVELYEAVDDRWGLGTAHRMLGLVALSEGDHDRARAELQRSLQLFEGVIVGWDLARALAFLGDASAATGDLTDARTFYLDALALTLRPEVSCLPLALDALIGLAELQVQEGELSQATEIMVSVVDHPAATRATISRAERALDVLEAQFGPGLISGAPARPAAGPIEALAERFLGTPPSRGLATAAE